MKMARKRENDESLVMHLWHVSGLTGLVNRLETLELWAIAHVNDQNERKRRGFSHASQSCIETYGPCKLPRNPRTAGNSSWKQPKTAKTTSFCTCLSNTVQKLVVFPVFGRFHELLTTVGVPGRFTRPLTPDTCLRVMSKNLSFW